LLRSEFHDGCGFLRVCSIRRLMMHVIALL